MSKQTARYTIGQQIRQLAASMPGGVIRWREAADVYVKNSVSAKADEVAGDTHFHLNLKRILKSRHFLRVQGTRGLYVLATMADGDNGGE